MSETGPDKTQDPPSPATGSKVAGKGQRSLLGSALGMGAVTLLSRFLGLAREMVTSFYLGTGHSADAFRLAFMIPNLFRRLVGEGAMTAAFVPTFTDQLETKRRDEAWAFAASFFWLLLLVLAGLTALGIVAAPWLVRWIFASGFASVPGKVELTSYLLRLLFAYVLFISLAALAQAMLNSLGRFAIPAFTPVLLNLAIILSAFFFARRFVDPSIAFALGVLAGGFLQFAFQYPFLLKAGFRLGGRVNLRSPAVRQVARLMAPAIFGAGIYQINVAVSQHIATYQTAGAVASLGYSARLMEVVLGIFVVSLSTVILPDLSRKALAKDHFGMAATLSFALRAAALVTIPATVGIILLRVPFVNLLFRFKGGSFDATSTKLTAYALLFHILGLTFVSGTRILVPLFYAFKDIRTPVKVASLSMVLNILLCLLLTGPLGHGGIALATSLSAVVQLLLLGWLARSRLDDFDGMGFARGLGRILLAAGIMGLACWGLREGLGLSLVEGKLQLLASTGLTVLASMLLFAAVLHALGATELESLVSLIRRKGR